tara:strand:- start:899 stop:2110 length:1212 start_codon:yes stop_codon:yes gene_type:complete
MLLTPVLKIPGFIGVRLEDLLVFCLIFYFAFIQRITFKVPMRVSLFVLFIPILLLSITVGSFLMMPASLLDLTKYIWLLKSIVIYLVFFNYIYGDSGEQENRIEEILRYFLIFSVVSSFICFQQYFNLFNLNKTYIPLIAPSQFTSLMPGYSSPRVVGMLGNPNLQGYVFALALNCMLFLLMKKRTIIMMVWAIVLLVAMLMTLSRGALVSFLVGALFLFFSYEKDRSFRIYKVFIFVFVCSILFIIIFWLKDNAVIYNLILFRFEMLSNISEDGSFVARFHGWLINYEYFKLSPLFGLGPLPRATEIFGMGDNEWLTFLRAYGVVGIVWLVCFMFAPCFLRCPSSLATKNRKNLVLSVLIITCVYMVPAAVITNSGLIGILLVILTMYDVSQAKLSIGFLKT